MDIRHTISTLSNVDTMEATVEPSIVALVRFTLTCTAQMPATMLPPIARTNVIRRFHSHSVIPDRTRRSQVGSQSLSHVVGTLNHAGAPHVGHN